MKLTELLKTHYPFELERGDMGDYDAAFKTKDGSSIELLFSYWPDPALYELGFYRDGEYSITAGGDAIKIFGTVVAATRALLKEEDPAGFIFSSKNSEMSRIFLYERLVKRLTADGRFVDATHRLDELKSEKVRNWFSNKQAVDKQNRWKLVVQADELGEPVEEALDTKIKYDVKTAGPRSFVATAEIDGKLFVFNADQDNGEGDYWALEFAQKDPMGRRAFGITNRGSQFKVGAFVAAAFEEFVQRYTPLRVTFSVDKEESPTARAKLYDRIMRRAGFELTQEIGETRIYDRV